MIIAIDFDGSVVIHEYPLRGKDIGAAPVLKKLVEKGHRLILYTMRSGLELKDAVAWFAENDIPLWGVNWNPEQGSWSTSPKIYANLYIDDAALGCPLTHNLAVCARPYVNWAKVETEYLRELLQ